MNTDQTSSMHEEAPLSEHIYVLSRGTSSTNDPLLRLAAQQSFNKNMAVMGVSLRSLKQNGKAKRKRKETLFKCQGTLIGDTLN